MTHSPSLSGIIPSGIPLSRREVVCGIAALVATAAVVPSAGIAAVATATPAMPENFRAISARLTGASVAEVSLEQASQIWARLEPLYSAERLATLISVVETTTDETAFFQTLQQNGVLDVGQALVRIWYTGAETSQPQSVLFYDTALAWTVCAFTKPAGTCGGLTGYWEQSWPEPQQETR